MASFNIGDVVRLKSGGPNMTVLVPVVADDHSCCYCVWFDTAHQATPLGQDFCVDILDKLS
ncbi:DUF2158 domain-containing protein [Aeromonas veronii]|uniref:DUF2158 domain-containing protein n=1 Tax=Aeromonas veronii TaxID=654 RepID=UPI000E1F071C|nr:DUF2158 domain-containing protein [Aeromonas veronii]RDU78768.1 hypothetical protein CHF44_18420 [Aeromonas veronii]RDU91834.1 hypothetical protein CHH34_14130 [Aeromonas veronii]TEY60830.1 hypothetical protein CIG15_17930 [Aeromonas veronii]